MSRLYRTRWFMPSFSLFLGAVMLGAFWIGGDPGQGLISLGVMAAVAALFYFGARRSETLAGLGGPARDERWEKIDVHASALTGLVLVLVIIGAWLVEVAQGRDGSPVHAARRGRRCRLRRRGRVPALAVLAVVRRGALSFGVRASVS